MALWKGPLLSVSEVNKLPSDNASFVLFTVSGAQVTNLD